MIATYNGRPFIQFEASGYSTDDVEEEIDNHMVEVFSNRDAPDKEIRGGAPEPILESINNISDNEVSSRQQ